MVGALPSCGTGEKKGGEGEKKGVRNGAGSYTPDGSGGG